MMSRMTGMIMRRAYSNDPRERLGRVTKQVHAGCASTPYRCTTASMFTVSKPSCTRGTGHKLMKNIVDNSSLFCIYF